MNYEDNIIDLKEKTENGNREYLINGKKYVSVTTMLSKTRDNRFLTAWRNRVGYKEAQKITSEAVKRGTLLHKEVENWFLNKVEGNSNYFVNIKNFLNRVQPIFFERVLYSDVLGVAGRVDCFGLYDGVPSIIDFKTSNKIKKREWITDYFLQCTCYSLCIEEMFGEKVKNLVVLMTTENDKHDFVENRNHFIPALRERIIMFRTSSSLAKT